MDQVILHPFVMSDNSDRFMVIRFRRTNLLIEFNSKLTEQGTNVNA